MGRVLRLMLRKSIPPRVCISLQEHYFPSWNYLGCQYYEIHNRRLVDLDNSYFLKCIYQKCSTPPDTRSLLLQ